jgi:hypothetical protein
MRKFIYFFAICFGLVTSAYSGEPGQVRVHYRLRTDTVVLHAPIVLLFTVHNGLTEPVTLNLGIDNAQFFQLSLATPDGKTLMSKPLRTEGFFSGTGIVTVRPGQEYEQKLLLNQWFPFDSVGTYRVTARLSTDIGVGEQGQLSSQGQTTRLVVKPRDAAELEGLCADLAKQIEDAPNAQLAREPALWLSYIRDPVAVPFLSRVLFARKLVESIAIMGLEKIANDDAIKVILSAVDDQFGDTAALARESLVRIESRAPTDPALRQRIKDTLSRSPS